MAMSSLDNMRGELGAPEYAVQSNQRHTKEGSLSNSGASFHSPASQAGQSAPGRLISDRGDGRSLREKFNVDTRTGGMSFSVPIRTSLGRSGFGPSLELSYNSGASCTNGVFGVGWQLNGADSISRKSSINIPTYGDDDLFVHSSAGDLVPVFIHGNKDPIEWDDVLEDIKYRVRLYQPRLDANRLRVERWSSLDGSDTTHWKSIASGNCVTVFGRDSSSCVAGHNGERELICSWLATETYDGFGNQMVFTYKSESLEALAACVGNSVWEVNRKPSDRSSQTYLKSIKYGNKRPNRNMETWAPLLDTSRNEDPYYWAFEVIFDYGEHPGESPTTEEDHVGWTLRPDPFSTHTSGFEIRTYRRCQRVLMFHHFETLKRQDYLVGATEFEYVINPRSGVSILKSYAQCGYQWDQCGKNLSCIRMPSNQFQYWQGPDLEAALIEELNIDLAGLTTPNLQWIDLYGDGAPGVLAKATGGGWYYHSNRSGTKPAIGKPSSVLHIPNLADSEDWYFEDLNGNGQLDVVFISPTLNVCGFYERSTDKEWNNFVPMESYPANYLAGNSIAKKVDLTGNGRSDILRLEAEHGDEFSWFPFLGRTGYGGEKRTVGRPAIPVGDERIYVATCDMTGDGLSDIAIICNTGVRYWPNMGYGCFGPEVVMANPPFSADDSSFNPCRIRMADVTGSGTSDLIYLPPEGGANIYYNQSGNGWSDVHVLAAFPQLNRFCAVDIFDVGGRGTQCLVWSSDLSSGDATASTTIRFIDLMGRCKPGVLTKCTNGIGGEIEISYRSSTHYQRDDEQAGRSWITRLPFPINCVESVIFKDLIAETSCTKRYAYHDGSYDSIERQFRGFQMVEEWDAEDFSNLSTQMFRRPPVHTKTWFYVGCQQLDEIITLPTSFKAESSQRKPLPTAKISSKFDMAKMTTIEHQDIYRSLAGKERRREVFSDDGTSKSSIPYIVTEQTFEVTMLQKICDGQRYGRYRVDGREEISSHYERDISEAMVQHTVTIQTDDYGNICKQAVINYGKAVSNLQDDNDQQRQRETFIAYTETDYTNAIDPYLTDLNRNPMGQFQIPLPSEIRRYQVYPGSSWVCNPTDRYDWESLATSLLEIDEVPPNDTLHTSASLKKGVKKLVSKERTLYSNSNLTKPLPLCEQESFSIGYQSYRFAFTERMLESTLRDGDLALLSESQLKKELTDAGYVQLQQSNEWWAPSSRKLFKDSIDDDTTESSLSTARSHFFISNAEIDPAGNVSHLELDEHCLLPVKSIDATMCQISMAIDYVHLQSTMVTDANGNRSQTLFDACGRPVGTATMGKPTESVGDSPDGFSISVSPGDLSEFLQRPSGPIAAVLLGKMGTRKIYSDGYQWDHHNKNIIPSFEAELVRDTHHQEASPSQINIHIAYFDGYGEVIQEASLSGNTEEEEQWQFSGWTIRDNKRQPVKQFLPFLATRHDFRPQIDNLSLPATTILRDPLDRVVAVLNADHTWSKTRFTPWAQVNFDAGDTVDIDDPADDQDVGDYFLMLARDSYYPAWKESNGTPRLAIDKSKHYHNTPAVTYKDALGRDILKVQDNGPSGSGRDTRTTRMKYNTLGNEVVELRDARDRVVVKTELDLLGRPLKSISMDSGSRWLLPDSLGLSFLSWTSRGDQKRTTYDKLRRVEQMKVRLPSEPHTEMVVTKNIYGESLPDARENNLNGQLYQCCDQAGVHTNKKFDIHGNCISASIRYAVEYKRILDWSKEDVELEPIEYGSRAAFNAIGKEISAEDFSDERVERTYDVAGRLKTLKLQRSDGATTSSIENIEYSEDGMITSIDYGNRSRTTNTYDRKTRKLTNAVTKRSQDGAKLVDMKYVYDCLGRIVYKGDQAQQTIYFDNTVVSPSQEFRYDALGQLLEATGREQVDASPNGQRRLRPYDAFSSQDNTVPGDGLQMVEYVETYEYDLAANIVKMQHSPRTTQDYTGWTRTYEYKEPSLIDPSVMGNRLTRTVVGKITETYAYDADAGRNGCMTTIPGYSMLTWDHNNRLSAFASQRVVEGATPETTWYVYNAEGKRVRKITERSSPEGCVSRLKKMKETRYLPLRDIFTVYNGDGSTVSRTITTTSLGDTSLADKPIVLVEHDSSNNQQVIRYQINENLELDESSLVVSYEEYSPYGSSTYQARVKGVPRKHRFMRYQRDSESGLYICGERYYAPWLGRWTSPDPLGTAGGLNLYAYVENNPVNFDDHQGTAPRIVGQPSTLPSGLTETMEAHIRQENIEPDFQYESGNVSYKGSLVELLPEQFEPQPGQTRRQIAQAKLNRTIAYTQVRLPLGLIKFSQSKISPEVHIPHTDQMSNVGDEIIELKAQAQAQAQAEQETEAGVAEKFMQKFGQISVTLVVGSNSQNQVGNEKNGWYSLDNRRLAIMKEALSEETLITARIASREELLNMVRVTPPDQDALDAMGDSKVVEAIRQHEKFSKIVNAGYYRGWTPSFVSELKQYFKKRKGKWSTRNDGSSITISGGRQ